MFNRKYMNSLKARRLAAVMTAACAVSVTGTACSGSVAEVPAIVDSQETTAAQNTEMEKDDASETEKGEISITAEGSDVKVSGANSDSVKVDGTTITITKQGTYRLSGTLSEGQILVEAGDKDDVRLILDGFSITNSETAPVNVVTLGDFTIELADGTENEVLDKRKAISEDAATESSDNADSETTETKSDAPDAAIYSKSDLIILGTGTLTVEGGYCDGIHGKDTVLVSEDVTLNITATEHGINGKDSLGIKAGTYEIKSGEDALHSKGDVTISDGTLAITATDDGIHAENNLTIEGGVIDITESYEGLEALAITINGGDISLKASDDGINAAGGADSSGGPFEKTEGAAITISGGKLRVIAAGDGLDSNGDLIVTGGEVYIDGPEMSGNASLDYTGEATISGGTVALTGSTGMFQSFGEDSTQPQIVVYYSEQQEAGTAITISDSEGNVIYENDDSTQKFMAFLYSGDGLKDGETYTVKTGDQEETVTIDGITNTIGERTGDMMMGGRGQGGFGMNGGHGGRSGDMGQGDSGMGNGQVPPEMNGEKGTPDMSNAENAPDMSGAQGESGETRTPGQGGPRKGGKGQGGRPGDMGRDGAPMDQETETSTAG